ncbi:hypothetical protein LSCM1_07182 [Leishmania martiniquensis]|uniref:Uncharacterized protein n=1 Tax=Leishmania martiniquensis TaxID=1580590 RepID=A0A836HZL5_9TRYP|nr:hypothetical protein LSCM1_07182 [Leishmania martiniquensis]
MYNFHKRADTSVRVGGDAGSGGADRYGANSGRQYERPSAGPQALHEDGDSAAQQQQQYCAEQQGHAHAHGAESGVGPYAEGHSAPVAGSAEAHGGAGQNDSSAYYMGAYSGQGGDAQQQQQQAYGQGVEAHGEEEEDVRMFADYRGPVDGERAERYHRRLQQQKQYDDIPMPPDDADPKEVFAYYRKLIGLVHFVPPRHWREIRFDLPANVAELRLYPQRRERVQDREPIRPSSCIAISLKGMLPENTTPSEYAAQMVQYMFELLDYHKASTAITELRFVKKGTELVQMVVTLGKDTRLAGRVLTELQAAGLRAYYGKPVYEFPPNATFQVVDYRRTLHDGKGILAEDLTFLLEPIRQYNTVDINVIEGYEPGVFYAPVKRPETVYSFLWNYFCSYKFQADLFRRYGVLVTMAQCPHEFLQKGIPYHIQKQQLEEKIRAELQRKGMARREGDGINGGVGAGEDDDDSDDGVNGSADEATGEGPPPAWAANAADEIDIFSPTPRAGRAPHQQQPISSTPLGPVGYGSGGGRAAATPNTVATAITFVDEEGLEDVDALLRQYNALTESAPPAAKQRDAAAKGRKAKVETAAESAAHVGGDGVGEAESGAPTDTNPQGEAYILPPPPPPPPLVVEGPGWGGVEGGYGSEPFAAPPGYAPEPGPHGYPSPPQYYPPAIPYGGCQRGVPTPRADPYPSVAQRSSSSYAAPPYAPRDSNVYGSATGALTTTATSPGGASSAYPLLVDEADDEGVTPQTLVPSSREQQASDLTAGDGGGGQADFDRLQQQQQLQLPPHSQETAPALHEKDMLLSWSMDEGLASSAGPGCAAIMGFSVPPPHGYQHSRGNVVRQDDDAEGSAMLGYGLNWCVFGDSQQQQQQLNIYETGAIAGGVLGDCIPTQPSYYPGSDLGSYPQPSLHPSAPWGYADSSSGAPMMYSEPMPMPPHVREAAEIVADLEERIQAAFPATWAAASDPSAQPFLLDDELLAEQELPSISEDSSCVLEHIPHAAAAAAANLVAPTTEIEELLSFLHRNVSLVGRLLHKTTTTTVEQAAEVAVFRARAARALLIGTTMTVGAPESPAAPEAVRAAWEERTAEDRAIPAAPAAANHGETEASADAEEASAETQLPALLPYLLRTASGVDLALLLAFHYPRAFSRRFLPYAPAYLLDENVARVIFATVLRRDTQAANVVVTHLLAHWSPLAQWLLRAAELKAAAKLEGGEASAEGSATEEKKSTTAAMKHVVSAIGSAIDTVLAVLSPAQRQACRAISDACDYVDAFAESVCTATAHEDAGDDPALPRLWGPDGALYRSLLRLYVNTDVCDGARVASRILLGGRSSSSSPTWTSLAAAKVCLTRDHYYYGVVLLSRSQTAPVLSRETAAFCGVFLKLLELQHTRWQQQQQQSEATGSGGSTATAPSVSEKEAEQLLDTAFKVMRTVDVYTALREAYLDVEVPITRFEAVLARLSPAEPSAVPQAQVLTLDEWYENSGNSGVRRNNSSAGNPLRKRGTDAVAIPSIFYYRPPSRRNARGNPPPPQQQQASKATLNAPSASGGHGQASIASSWRQEWTEAMRTYPPSGTPFSALPEGWTSQLSRENGHYCFKPPLPGSSTDEATAAGTAASASALTYKHPLDGKEHLVTPQAFLLERGAVDASSSSVTLDQVRTRANAMHAAEATAIGLPPPAELTAADAEAWASDQRRRNVFLDIAVMELLGITYRAAGRAGTAAPDTAATSGVKRGRDTGATGLTPEELQQLLIKAIPNSYPAVGAPYPAVGRGWSVYLNSARGQYAFKGGAASRPSQPPLFVHPKTGKHYFVSPQAFVQQRQVNLEVVARVSGVDKKGVASWMSDQRNRHTAIDAAAVKLIPITYSDVDKAMEENMAAAKVTGETNAETPLSPSRDRDRQQQPLPSSRHRSEREGLGSNGGRRRRRHEDSDSDASHTEGNNHGGGGGGRGSHRRRRERSPRRRSGNGGGGDRRRR